MNSPMEIRAASVGAITLYARRTPGFEERVAHALAVLQSASVEHTGRIVQATSLGAADMVLTDLIARHAPGIEVFTLDTGRLPAETYDLLQTLADRYDIRIRIVYPERESLEQYVATHGVNGFYRSVEARKPAARRARSNRCAARWQARRRGSPDCAAPRR